MSRTNRRLPALFLLLAILLVMQSFSLAHTSTHDLHTDSDQCSTCLRAGQYKSMVVTAGITVAPIFHAVRLDKQACTHPATNHPHISRARGPPSLGLS